MFIIYLLFGCLIKIGSIFHIIKVLGGSENQKIETVLIIFLQKHCAKILGYG